MTMSIYHWCVQEGSYKKKQYLGSRTEEDIRLLRGLAHRMSSLHEGKWFTLEEDCLINDDDEFVENLLASARAYEDDRKEWKRLGMKFGWKTPEDV